MGYGERVKDWYRSIFDKALDSAGEELKTKNSRRKKKKKKKSRNEHEKMKWKAGSAWKEIEGREIVSNLETWEISNNEDQKKELL